jgi:quercetin dioxygenase-like cupin family protein
MGRLPAGFLVVAGLGLASCTSRPPPPVGTPTDPRATATSVAPTGPFRRVVTGLDASGRSAVVEDGPVPASARVDASSFDLKTRTVAPFTRYILEADGIWFGALPLPPGAPVDPLRGPPLPEDGFTPRLPSGGFAAAMLRWAPGGPEFPMHDSPTVDLMVIVSGAMELRLESGSTIVRPGDVVVQRGTKHTWKVVGDEPCVAFGILLDARAPPERK